MPRFQFSLVRLLGSTAIVLVGIAVPVCVWQVLKAHDRGGAYALDWLMAFAFPQFSLLFAGALFGAALAMLIDPTTASTRIRVATYCVWIVVGSATCFLGGWILFIGTLLVELFAA